MDDPDLPVASLRNRKSLSVPVAWPFDRTSLCSSPEREGGGYLLSFNNYTLRFVKLLRYSARLKERSRGADGKTKTTLAWL